MNPRSVTSCHQQPSNLPQPDSLSVFFLLEVCAGDEDNDCVQYDYLQGDVQDDVELTYKIMYYKLAYKMMYNGSILDTFAI